MHALDHLRRMYGRLRQTDRIDTLRDAEDLQRGRRDLLDVVVAMLASLDEGIDRQTCNAAERLAHTLHGNAEAERERAIALAVEHDLSVAQTNQLLAAQRWLERMAHHVWRISAHLGGYEITEEEPD